MKWSIRASWISHLLAVVVGVLIWQAVGKKSVKAPESPDDSSKRVVSRDPAEAEVRLRLGALQAENNRPISSLDLPKEPLPKEAEVKKSVSQHLLEMRAEDQADTAKELEAMLKRSEDFRKVEDLRVPLIEALTQGDQTHTAVAIFIEWYRRDPVMAMNELAARPSWSSDVLSEQAMVLHLTPDMLLDQLNARNRSSDFREAIIDSLAEHWVATDDLRSLSAAYDKLGGNKADALMEAFLDERWVPRDGAADLTYVSAGMSANCRKAFLTELLNQGSYDPSREWTDGIASAMIRQILGEEQVAALRKEKAEQEAHGPTGGGCCGGVGDEDYATPDQVRIAELMAKITPGNDSGTLSDVLERMLQHDRDYLELFGTGKLTADQVYQEMIAQIPGAKDYELGLRQELYQKLAIWNPKAAVEWASAHLSETDLLSVTIHSDGIDYEPRASRMLDLLENLPLKFEDGRYVGQAPWNFYRSVRDWTKLDPETANLELSRSPETQDIAEKIIKQPSTKDFEDLLPPMSDEEPSY